MESVKKLLPKTYFQRKRVAQEVYIALTHYKNLTPMLENYVFNDGRTNYLMCLSGTIPILFEDESYNIPVCLWLDESFPLTAPLCYVKPTHEMMTVTGKHINHNGEVILPFLQQWHQDTCDLLSLLQVMSAVFGEFPPVCVRTQLEAAQASCSLQFCRQAEDQQLFLTRDDEQPFHQDNETNC